MTHTQTHDKKPLWKKWWVWLIAVLLIIGAFGSQGNKTDASNIEYAQSTINADKQNSYDAPASESRENVPSDTNETPQPTAPTPEPVAAPEPEVPREFQSALKKAKTYSEMMHMSKQGIFDQLTSEHGEKFSAEAGQYAIDHLQVDYKANALEKAKTYQDMMDMSPDAIYEQLVSEYGEKFTPEEAEYAVANLPK